MQRHAAAIAAMLLLTGCAAAQGEPSSTSPTASPSQSLLPFQVLTNAVDASINRMMASGSTEYYEIDGKPFYTAVYDPAFKGDYLGAGLMSESDQVDLMLELDMYALYQLARAVSESGIEATTLEGDAYLVTIDPNRKGLQGFPTSMRATIGADGLVTRVDYPSDREPDAVRFMYSVDAAGTAILQRANDEFKKQ
jgi:hypothetical protein